jgi:hypothetical protein
MKKILILITLIISGLSFSQTATKSQENRSNIITSYVIEKLELNNEDADFFRKVHLFQIVDNALKIKENNAKSADQKRVIYREGYEKLKAKLSEKMGNKKALAILRTANEARTKQ